MGKSHKRKKGSSDTDTERLPSKKKGDMEGGLSGGATSVSDMLNQTNSVLYGKDAVAESVTDSVFIEDSTKGKSGENGAVPMATEASEQLSLKDVMSCLQSIASRLGLMDKRLDALEEVKQRLDKFDTEIKKLWVALDDKNKKVAERVATVEVKIESSDFSLGLLNDKVVTLEKEKELLQSEVTYLQPQSMRNNLLFSNIPEVPAGSAEDAEVTVREFMVSKMKIAKEAVDRMALERVHRIGPRQQGRARKIVAKFLEFKDKEFVRIQWKSLEGTEYYVGEQFPKEIVEKRRRLYPKLKKAREDGKRAWISYDTLYVDGKAVRD